MQLDFSGVTITSILILCSFARVKTTKCWAVKGLMTDESHRTKK